MNRPPLRDTPAAPLVFFTGGTALRALSRHLAAHAVPAVHIVTTFDSGGSTAVLRRAERFDGEIDPALRSRLQAALGRIDAIVARAAAQAADPAV